MTMYEHNFIYIKLFTCTNLSWAACGLWELEWVVNDYKAGYTPYEWVTYKMLTLIK